MINSEKLLPVFYCGSQRQPFYQNSIHNHKSFKHTKIQFRTKTPSFYGLKQKNKKNFKFFVYLGY